MKYYAFILLLILGFVACRSNRSVDRTIQEGSTSTQTGSSIKRDSTSTITNRSDSSSNISTERKYLRTTAFRPDGTVRFVQEEWWGAERAGMAVSHSGSSDVSVKNEKTDSTAILKKLKNLDEKERSNTDSRPIQGSEWGWIALIICIVIGVAVLIIYRKYGKRKSDN